MINSDRVMQSYRAHLSSTQAVMASMLGSPVEISASGSVVTAADGREYLDCGGHGVFLLGHRCGAIVDAVKAVLDTQPIQSRFLLNPTVAAGAEALIGIAPQGLDRVIFQSSGTEAVETAIKLARLAGRRRLISMRGGYHGKTMGALTLMANVDHRQPFAPLLPDAASVEFGNSDALRDVVTRYPGDCCVVVEPVQGEGGVRIPPTGYLSDVAESCHESGALLVLDEIQTGLGRTGSWWCGAESVAPDILVCGKILGGGVVPASATVTSAEIFGPLHRDPGLHSSTFANAPLIAAAAKATIDLIRDTGLLSRVRAVGDRVIETLRTATEPFGDIVRDVRGIGLLAGVEFFDVDSAGTFLLELLSRGVMPTFSQTNAGVVRFTPSVYLSDAQIGWLASSVTQALQATAEALRVPE